MTARRSNGVHAANYVLHVKVGDGVRVACGRDSAEVNCLGPNDPVDESVCRTCRSQITNRSRSRKGGDRK